MTRLFLSIISLYLLIYTPYAFGEISLSLLGNTSSYTEVKQYEKNRSLLSQKLWKSYMLQKQIFSSYPENNTNKTISENNNVSNKKRGQLSKPIKQPTVIPSNSMKQTLSISKPTTNVIQTKTEEQPVTPKDQSTLLPLNSNKKESIDLVRKHEIRRPSIIEPIPSIKPSLI